jgi:formylmethanofuran dehydrogenase subunit E
MMKSDKQITDALKKCELCEQKMNPTVNIYKNDTRLCKGCFEHMANMPEVVANCVERFLIGNVV